MYSSGMASTGRVDVSGFAFAELTQLVAAAAEIRSAKMNAAASFFVASTS